MASPAASGEAPADGTITFLFTDIEGSTRLLKAAGADYGPLLDTHRRLLRAAFTAHHGREVDTQGDSFFVAFANPSDAVAASVEAQRALAAHDWPPDRRVRVRMGLHTGEATAVGSGYVGLDVHRGARIGAVAHGDQILVSETTAALVRGRLPDGAELRDLGEHRLKDLDRPERLYQLQIAGPGPRLPGSEQRRPVRAPPRTAQPVHRSRPRARRRGRACWRTTRSASSPWPGPAASARPAWRWRWRTGSRPASRTAWPWSCWRRSATPPSSCSPSARPSA